MKTVALYCGRAVRMLSDNLVCNPVVTKELRTRMRGLRTFLLMGGYIILLAVVALISYAAISAVSRYQYGAGVANERIGLQLFAGITWTQSILLLLVIPALCSRALTGEIEGKTIELLVLTRLTAGRIVVGKLLSGFLYSMVLLLSSLPMAGICILLGGISPVEAFSIYMLLVAWSFLLASVSVFWSSLFSRTTVSSLFSYATGGLYMLINSSVAGGIAFSSMYSGTTDSMPAFVALSPGVASYVAGQNTVICGITMPATLGAFVFHAAVGVLLLLVATMHVRYKPADRSLSVRLLLMGITAAIYWAFLGDRGILWNSPPSLDDVQTAVSMALFSVIVLVGIALPIFATGPIRRKNCSPYLFGLLPSKALRGDLGGSIAFVLLWAGLLCATVIGTISWASNAYHASGFGFTPAAQMRIWPVLQHTWFALTFVVLAVLAGLSAIGIMSSAIANRKGEAVALVILASVASIGLYWAIYASYVHGVSNRHNPAWQLAAFWPVLPFFMVDARSYDGPPLWWRLGQSWLVVGTAYIAIAACALGTASKLLRKRQGVRED